MRTEKPARKGNDFFVPTEDQIREACTAIQSEWTDTERSKRWCHKHVVPAMIQTVAVRDIAY